MTLPNEPDSLPPITTPLAQGEDPLTPAPPPTPLAKGGVGGDRPTKGKAAEDPLTPAPSPAPLAKGGAAEDPLTPTPSPAPLAKGGVGGDRPTKGGDRLPNAPFQFSQSSLQDFIDCPRRFELRYLLHQKWPALQSEPVLEYEHHSEIGTRFHRLVHQKILGLPTDTLETAIDDPQLMRWWQVFQHTDPLQDLPGHRYPEHRLTAAFNGHRLVAQYDLLSIDPGHKAIILDWKTATRRPSAAFLRERMQTRLYPFLLTLAGASLNGGTPFAPEQVELHYWFPAEPDKPEVFAYTQEKYHQDLLFLTSLIQNILDTRAGYFLLTTEEKLCRYCEYRSLCDRGTTAGDWQEIDDPDFTALPENGLDFEQIGDIIF